MNHTTMDNSKRLVERLERLLAAEYEIERNGQLNGQKIDLQARSKQMLQHYALSKKLVIDESRINDFLFCQIESKTLTKELLSQRFDWLRDCARSFISSDACHMRSRFVGILLSETNWLPDDISQVMKSCHQTRWLKWGLHGWYEATLVCYHLPTGTVHSHPKGKDFVAMLEQLGQTSRRDPIEKES